MATAGDNVIKTDHVIIWLDPHMGVQKNNESSKNILDKNANLDRPLESEYSSEIDDLIINITSEMSEQKFEDLIKSPLRMFVDESECIKCINDNIEAKKQPFLIASGQKGKLLVPKIHAKLSGHIYIFCARRDLHAEWTQLYDNDLVVYDDEKGVFAKVLSDIAIHYLTKAQNEISNERDALQYLCWAKRLFISATKLDQVNRKDFLECVHDELNERKISISDGNDSDCQMGEDPDEV